MDIFEMICHTCNKENDKLFNIRDELYSNNEPSIIDMLEYSTKIKLDTTNNYPKYICYSCIKKLEIAYKFLKRFHLAHKEFLLIQAKITNSIKSKDSEKNVVYADNADTEVVTISPQMATDDNFDAAVIKKSKIDNSEHCIIPVRHPAAMAISVEQTILKTENTNCRVTCNKCTKSFYTELALNLHMKIYHR